MIFTAIRIIRVSWRVTKIESPDVHNEDDDDEDDGLDWSNFQGERLPIVHFAGTSRSLHASWDPNANSKIRGKWAKNNDYVLLLKLMRNEALSGKPPKGKSDGRHSPSSMARSGGDPRAFKSVGLDLLGVYWAIGSISMIYQKITRSTNIADRSTGTMILTDLLDRLPFGRRAIRWKIRTQFSHLRLS